MVEILANGLLVNELGKPNPRECEQFRFQVEYIIDSSILSDIHIRWEIEGDIPNDVVIDKDSGLLSGKVKMFIDQDLPSHLYNPKEPLEVDGSNYQNDGRFTDPTYDFNFTIRKVTLLEDVEYIGEPIETTLEECIEDDSILLCMDEGKIYRKEFTTSDVTIKLVRNGNVGNTLFMINYLDNDEITSTDKVVLDFNTLSIEIVEDRRHISFGDRKYYKEDTDELLSVHPGPFIDCED